MSGRMQARLAVMAAAMLTLAGCLEGQDGLFKNKADRPDATADAPRSAGSRDVLEAPDVFDVTATALWDGRPSLGKVWVAYEGADPASVIIRNEENGKVVRGALFRRERFFPGPPFQMSADAAAALGILAGNPTKIHVTALKEVVTAPPPEPEPEAAPAPEAEAAAVAEAPAEAAPEAAAIAAAAAAAIAAPAEGTEAHAEPAPPPRRPVSEGPNAPEPRLNPVFEAPPEPAPEPDAAAAPVAEPGAIETTDIVPAAAAAIAAAEASAPAAPEAQAEKSTGLNRPYIQIGLFSVPENAASVVQKLADNGIIATTIESTAGDRTFTRVIVGPARNLTERAALLKQIKALGFADAFFVKG